MVRPFPDLLQYSINQVASPINFPTACSVAHNILAAGADCDNVIIVFNEFKNAISQQVKKTEIMSRTFFVKHFKYVTRHEATEPEKDWA